MTNTFDPVIEFATKAAQAKGRQNRMDLLAQAMAPFGVKMFAYARVGTDHSVQAIETTYPGEWIAHYLESRYSETDIVALEAFRAVAPFEWRELLTRGDATPAARKIFAEAADFGIHEGFTMPIRGAGGMAMISFVVEDTALLGDKGMAHRHALQLMAMYYHSVSSTSTPDEMGLLTPREREVLLWTARGKTGWEIGQILNLSERTVTFHAENAKVKLGAASRSHAAVRAIMQGLIAP